MRYLYVFIVLLLAAVPAMASGTTGDVTLGGLFVGGDNTDDSAKFLEYRDIRNQVTSDLSVFSSSGGQYFIGEAKNVGYNDQEYLFKGGVYGKGKYSLWYDELTHNYGLGAKTLHTGTGSGNLITTGAIGTPSTWLEHDFKAERKQIGASFEVDLQTPFFVAGEVTQTKKEGTYLIAVQNTAAGSGGTNRTTLELPAPIDYTTNNFSLKTGYRTEKIFIQIDGLFSSFKNGDDLLEWQTTGGAQGITYTLAPDNKSMQFGGQVTVRDLPIKSVLSLRASYAKNESDPTLPALAGATIWDGDQSYTNFAAAVKSHPMEKLTTKVAYHYTKKGNDGAIIDYRDPNDGALTNHAFEYTKNKLELEGTYRLDRANRMKGGYEFEMVKRPVMRHDAEKTKTHTLFAEWKNSSFDTATGKLRYERLMRKSDFEGDTYADTFLPTDAEEILRYSRPFDAADKNKDTIKLKLDLMPSETFDVGLELAYSHSDYKETMIGRTDDKGQSVLLDASIALPMAVKVYAYVAYDKVVLKSDHVKYRNGVAFDNISGGVPVVDTAETADRFDWDVARTDIGTSYGIKCQMPLLSDRLNLSASWDYQKNDGEADFTATTQTLEDITAYDDYKMQTFKLTGEYALQENMTILVGYTYEKFEQNDILTDDLVNVVGSRFFSGAYANNDYKANIGTLALTYKF